MTQVPGFTYPVTDLYLEDVLALIGYQDRLLGQGGRQRGHHHAGGQLRAGAGQPRAGSQAGQQAAAAEVPQEQREEIEGAIMDAFLHGSDEHFDRLLEVRWIELSSCHASNHKG